MTKTDTTYTTDSDETSQSRANAVISGAQQAADVARQTAERAAAQLPDAVARTQVAARDTQVALEGMDGQTLMSGTTFSLGLGIGLFLSGAHRVLVVAAFLPAIAMALTLLGRQQEATSPRRASSKS